MPDVALRRVPDGRPGRFGKLPWGMARSDHPEKFSDQELSIPAASADNPTRRHARHGWRPSLIKIHPETPELSNAVENRTR